LRHEAGVEARSCQQSAGRQGRIRATGVGLTVGPNQAELPGRRVGSIDVPITCLSQRLQILNQGIVNTELAIGVSCGVRFVKSAF